MEPIVTEEQLARQAPEAQAIIRLLLAKIVKMEAEIDVLRRQMQGDNATELVAAAQHATSARQADAAEAQIETEARRTAGPQTTRTTADSNQPWESNRERHDRRRHPCTVRPTPGRGCAALGCGSRIDRQALKGRNKWRTR